MKNEKNLVWIVLLLLLPSAVFAVDLPAVVTTYVDIIMKLLVDYLAVILILVVLMVGAYQSSEVGNAKPFKWGVFAALGIGSAAFFGESIISYASQVFNLTGTDAITSTS